MSTKAKIITGVLGTGAVATSSGVSYVVGNSLGHSNALQEELKGSKKKLITIREDAEIKRLLEEELLKDEKLKEGEEKIKSSKIFTLTNIVSQLIEEKKSKFSLQERMMILPLQMEEQLNDNFKSWNKDEQLYLIFSISLLKEFIDKYK